MASKTKKYNKKRESPLSVVLVSLSVGIIALLQNKYGNLSDLRSFYSMHFSDGQHVWPFSEKILLGKSNVQHPVEYPALTGLIMWLLSFLINSSAIDPNIQYYRLTAGFQIVLFTYCSYLIYKIAGKKYAFYFMLAPAVLYSLNRNWDIWAIAPMLAAILFFERKKHKLSAFLLSVSIATKFFPVVLLLPITVIFLRGKNYLALIKYLAVTLILWVMINLPFVIINFKGWAYFYEFSAKRTLGSASFYEITSLIFASLKFSTLHFYILNISIFLLVTFYFVKLKQIPTLVESSFFVMFAFILFNKQYSMQYIIWLTVLSVLVLSKISNKNRELLVYIFILWQVIEFAFQYAYFQHLLTDYYANTETPMTIQVSSQVYAYIGVARYLIAIIFCLLLAKFLRLEKSIDKPQR